MESLKNYKKKLLDLYLKMHWRQWSAIGIQSHIPESDFPVDIEALLISTFRIARYDKRLFYAMLEWLDLNRNLVSVSRAKNILKTLESDSDNKNDVRNTDLLINILKQGSVKSYIQVNIDNQYHEILREYSKRGVVQKITLNNNQSLQLKFRSIFGVNARADIILYLLAERKQNANKIAKEIFYDQKIVHRVLKNWEMSDFVRREESGNEILYSLNEKSIFKDLNRTNNREFINQPLVFFTLGRIISIIRAPEFQEDPYLISSQLRKIYNDIIKVSNITDLKLEKEVNFPGEELFYYLQKTTIKIFSVF